MLSHALRATTSKDLELSYIGTYTSASANGTTITFTGVSLGDPAPNRRIYVIVLARPTTNTTATLSSASIAGVSGSVLAQAASASTASSTHACFGVEVPTGTSDTVSVTFTTSVQASIADIFVYRVVNQNSAVSTALVNNTTSNGTTGTSFTNTLTTELGGFALNSLTLTAARTMTYTNMPINSGTGSSDIFSGGKDGTTGASENFTFTIPSAVSGWKRFGISLKR